MAVLIVSACVSPMKAPEGERVLSAEAWFKRHPEWSVRGRVALSDGKQGGQLDLNWQSQANTVAVTLSTRFGNQWWQLEFDERSAVLRGHEGDEQSMGNADELVAQATGWPIPVSALHYWVRGLEPPQTLYAGFGRAREAWQIEVTDQQWVSDGRGQATLLPRRIEAKQGQYRIRVVFGQWDWGKSRPTG